MRKNNTLIELLIGIFAVGIVAQIACLVFLKNQLYHAVGLWVGVLLSAGLAVHMQYSIEDGLELAGEDGVKHMQKSSVIRMLIVCGVTAVVFYKGWGNPITLLIGITALKLGAYMQPFVHAILEKRKGG